MVTNSPTPTLDPLFAALADPTRRAILARLGSGPANVGELAEPFAMSRPAISKHLDVLERAGVVRRVRHGRENRCHLVAAPLAEAMRFMVEQYRRHWEHQFDALATWFDNHPEQ
jgi:DNA-binding transcriptional ArsR family regulator